MSESQVKSSINGIVFAFNPLNDQIAAQTKAIAEKDSRIADLEKQLAQKPADETAQVINEPGKPAGLTPEAEFAQNLHNAQELYNQLP